MECKAFRSGDELVLENDLIRHVHLWNRGAPIVRSITDKTSGREWLFGDGPAGLGVPGAGDPTGDGGFTVETVAETPVAYAHLKVTTEACTDALELRRVFRLYPGCPAVACDSYVRGAYPDIDRPVGVHEGNLPNIEDAASARGPDQPVSTMIRLALPGIHYRLTAVRFFDVTDRNNNLVGHTSILAYRSTSRMTGNLLFIEPLLDDGALFLLKEAPGSSAHLAYPGFDFSVQATLAPAGPRASAGTAVEAVGFGLHCGDVNAEGWVRGYGVVLGTAEGGRQGAREALRCYTDRQRRRLADRDEMLLMNTWGDRGQDTRMREEFVRAEVDAGARLGVTHLQLDDGWQAGRSSNSAFEGGSLAGIWDNPQYWRPHPERFPNGLEELVRYSAERGIELGLWFNPSTDESYGHWREDAETLIGLHREHGIRAFKIDGVQIPDKRAEINLRRMFDAVLEATNGAVVFNLDVTAGRRFGYFTFCEYGNRFLENRYTDWSNYYPHWTLRNLWMLAWYLAPQTLQIEFLNHTRNPDNYPADDPLAPRRMSFAYCFAVTMMAQPLAWFEGTGLPDEAFGLADVIEVYRRHQRAIHAGTIFPIGEEPCGSGWTGFQSTGEDGGYVLVYRELNGRETCTMELRGFEGRRAVMQPLCGDGEGLLSDGSATVTFRLPAPFTYALYRYTMQDR